MAVTEADAEGLGLEKLDREIKTIHTQEALGVRHALPKSHMAHALLHENTSQDRHLSMKLQLLRIQRNRVSCASDINRRSFVERQASKHRKWKRDDDVRMTSFNIPQLRGQPMQNECEGKGQSEVADYIYRGPRYYDPDSPAVGQVILPYMRIERERTEVIRQQDRTFITRIPTNISVDIKDFKRYSKYCGSDLIKRTTSDERFVKLEHALSPLKKSNTDLDLFKEDIKSGSFGRTSSNLELYNTSLPVLVKGKGVNCKTYIRTPSRKMPRSARKMTTTTQILSNAGLDRLPTVIVTGASGGEKDKSVGKPGLLLASSAIKRGDNSNFLMASKKRDKKLGIPSRRKIENDLKSRNLADLQGLYSKLNSYASTPNKHATQKTQTNATHVKLPKILPA